MSSIVPLYKLYKNRLASNQYKKITFNAPKISNSNTTFDNIFVTETTVLENLDEKFEDWITYRYAKSINDTRYKSILDTVFDITDTIDNELLEIAWMHINIGEYTLTINPEKILKEIRRRESIANEKPNQTNLTENK
jgi:hypothetical protein